MQNMLQNVQSKYGIYNSDIEPEHETDMYCNCAVHQYKRRKMNRLGVQSMWSKAVMYPGKLIELSSFVYNVDVTFVYQGRRPITIAIKRVSSLATLTGSE